MDKPIVTRQQAIACGAKRYYTGLACKKGHVAERFTSSSGCIECVHPKVYKVHPVGSDLKKLAHTFTVLVDRRYNADHIIALKAYLQQCADYHVTANELALPHWCPRCDGRGKTIDPSRNPVVLRCDYCKGAGSMTTEEMIAENVKRSTEAPVA